MTLLDLLNAVADRVKRINGADGYSTDLGSRVDVERVSYGDETETYPRVTVVSEPTNFEREGAVSAGVDSLTEIAVAGLIAVDFDDRATAPVQLQNDLLRAIFEKPASGDVISTRVSAFEPISAEIIRPNEGERLTEVLVVVRARWCDETLNTALEG